MNSLEMCAQIIANGFLPAAHPNYSLTVPGQLIKELNDTVTQNFERAIVNARQGYWLHSTLITCVAGTTRYRIPHRAASTGLDRVELADSLASAFYPLNERPGRQALDDEIPGTAGGNGQGSPRSYEIRGEHIALLPTPNAAYVLRVWYYARPSQLVLPQSPTFTGTSAVDSTITDRGRITVAPVGAGRTVTVNAIPFRMNQTTPASIVTNVDRVDVVKPNGWYETVLVEAGQTFSGSVITFLGSDPLGDIEVGDYVRAADESEWPPLQKDFHRLVCDIGSLAVLTQLTFFEKAQVFGQKAASDMERFRDVLQPRVKDQAREIDFPDHILNGGGGSGRRGAWGA